MAVSDKSTPEAPKMLNVAQWQEIKRPGYFGSRRDEVMAGYDRAYGPDNWQIAWKISDLYLEKAEAVLLYEDAYFEFMRLNPIYVEELARVASNVFDDSVTNVKSGLDYTRQETERTHLQDIAIRRSLVRLGAWFYGDRLVQIRDSRGEHPLSLTLSPGRVPFHRAELLQFPELEGWWLPGSVESFYQSNKVLLARADEGAGS